MKKIISQLKKADLKGRGGANFPTYLKWQTVLEQKADKVYIVANGSEGEPRILKDGFIVKNYSQELIDGVKVALDTFENSQAFIYLRKDYYQKYKNKLKKLIGNLPIEIIKEKGSYLSGEETTVCQEIEGVFARPRIKPPYPAQSGIFGQPTLINNIETFYYIGQVAKNKYKGQRFYTILGKVKKPGVYELPGDWSIEKVLKKTGNLPEFDFFLQVGGGASGEILLADEIDQTSQGRGSIVVYDKELTDPWVLMRQWADFFMQQNCDKCTPCREGVYRLDQMIKNRKIDQNILADLFFVLENTSFCALGKMTVLPFKSAIEKLLPKEN